MNMSDMIWGNGTISQGGASLHTASSPHEFSWGSKFADGVFIVANLPHNLYQKETTSPHRWWGATILFLTSKYVPGWAMFFQSPKIRYHKNSFEELFKCGETLPSTARYIRSYFQYKVRWYTYIMYMWQNCVMLQKYFHVTHLQYNWCSRFYVINVVMLLQ